MNIYQQQAGHSRSISAENFNGEKGRAAMADPSKNEGHASHESRELGVGWKVSPCIQLAAAEVRTLADITGSGRITHIWAATEEHKMRHARLRVYWDGSESPSINVPLGDFFCNAWGSSPILNSLAVSVAPRGGHNFWIPMPFRRKARFEIENTGDSDLLFYYQIDYQLCDVEDDALYLHCQFNLSDTLPDREDHTLLQKIHGTGHYLGSYVAWQVTNPNWWGEGEIKFFIDGDDEYPTICGTGTEDYFGGAWNFEQPKRKYGEYSQPYQGFHDVSLGRRIYKRYQKFGMYRFHFMDPICFKEDLKITLQSLGWQKPLSRRKYNHQRDYISSVAWWYQTNPGAVELRYSPEELNTPNVYGAMNGLTFRKGRESQGGIPWLRWFD